MDAATTAVPSGAPSTSSAPSSGSPGAPSGGSSPSGDGSPAPLPNGAASTIQEPAKAPPVPKKYKVKVEGQEHEVDEAELLRGYSINKMATRRAQEAAQMRKQAQEVLELAKSDPVAFLQHPSIGADVKKLFQSHLQRELEMQQMSPDQRELAELRLQYEAEKKHRESYEQQRKQEEGQRQVDYYRQEYDKSASAALAESGLPRTPTTLRRMAELQMKNLKMGLDLEPSQLTSIVREEIAAEQVEILKSLSGEQLHKMLGEETGKKLREYDLSRLKTTAPVVPAAEQPVSEEPSARIKRLTKDEWREAAVRRTK